MCVQTKDPIRASASLILVAAVTCLACTGFGFTCRQAFRTERVTRGNVGLRHIQEIDSASWIGRAGTAGCAQAFSRFRCPFRSDGAPFRIDVSADARYVLLLDGREISRGPHKGFPEKWYYQTYDIAQLAAGDHVMEAVVFTLGDAGPRCLLTTGRSGFILKASGAYDRLLTTGRGAWRVAAIPCMRFGRVTDPYVMTGRENIVTGTGFLDWPCATWERPVQLRGPIRDQEYGYHVPMWEMFPTERRDERMLPGRPGAFRAAQDRFTATNAVYGAEDVRSPWVAKMNALLAGRDKVVIPAGRACRFLWDLDTYRCAYPVLGVSGGRGAEIRWAWTESLYAARIPGNTAGLAGDRRKFGAKGDRRAFAGKRVLYAMHDTFLPDGRARATFTLPWWKCGRWIEISVRTGDEPLELTGLSLVETYHPLDERASFACDDPTIAPITRLCANGLRNCLHESFMDCPYFEQQMYCGDTRVEILVHNILSGDGRILRHAIGLFDAARRNNGLVPMNFPSVGCQDSSTFSLLWVTMCGDYALWHGADAFLRARVPGMRHTLSCVAGYRNREGLLEDPPGWSFMDWVTGWDAYGNAPDGRRGVSAVNNLLFAYALKSAASVEAATGDAEMAAYWTKRAEEVSAAVRRAFWVPERGLIADTLKKDRFSEHAQCLALLTDTLPPDVAKRCFAALLSEKDLARATVYFSHYLFETYFTFGRADLFFERLNLWRAFLDSGLTTPLEAPADRARSDCHAWGAHPLYHLHTGVAGVRPTSPGARTVRLAPQPGPLGWFRAKTAWPGGVIAQDLRFADGGVSGTVELPEGVTGTFVWGDRSQELRPGRTVIDRRAARGE